LSRKRKKGVKTQKQTVPDKKRKKIGKAGFNSTAKSPLKKMGLKNKKR
jgi:hypothetical protein